MRWWFRRHFEVDYVVRAKTEEEARDQANKIAHEQTVELPASYVSETYAEIADHVVQTCWLRKVYVRRGGPMEITISYHTRTLQALSYLSSSTLSSATPASSPACR